MEGSVKAKHPASSSLPLGTGEGLATSHARAGQVRRTILDAWGWCTATTQRDGMGREEGGGFRMGNTCISVADSF